MAKPAVNIFHLLLVVPLLVYLAARAPSVPGWMRIPLAALGALLILFHGGVALREWRARRSGGRAAGGAAAPLAVRLVHVLIAGPLFLYLGLAPSPHPAAPLAVALLVFLFHGARLTQYWVVSCMAAAARREGGGGGGGEASERELLRLEQAAAAAI
jgi:hypothetical protein